MIDNPRATRVKRVAALSRKKERLLQGSFIVEGPQAVRELLFHQPELADVVFATTGSESWQPEIDRLADRAEVEIVRVTPEVLAAMAETVNPQGVVAIANLVEATLDEALEDAKLVAVLHEVRDPGNAGTVLRAADAAGADAVLFVGDSIDPWHPKVVRATTGSLFHLPVARAHTLEEALVAVKYAGLQVLAADVRGDNLHGADSSLAVPTAWVFGNEARGLSPENIALADRSMRLPLFGKAESLNLAAAASVCLYTTAFAQRAAAE